MGTALTSLRLPSSLARTSVVDPLEHIKTGTVFGRLTGARSNEKANNHRNRHLTIVSKIERPNGLTNHYLYVSWIALSTVYHPRVFFINNDITMEILITTVEDLSWTTPFPYLYLLQILKQKIR